jgi:hypothetical protein
MAESGRRAESKTSFWTKPPVTVRYLVLFNRFFQKI